MAGQKFNGFIKGVTPRAAVLSRDWDNEPDEYTRTSRVVERHRARCGEESGFDPGDINPKDFF